MQIDGFEYKVTYGDIRRIKIIRSLGHNAGMAFMKTNYDETDKEKGFEADLGKRFGIKKREMERNR